MSFLLFPTIYLKIDSMKDFNTYEKNEYQIGRSFTQLYQCKDVVINPTINPHQPIDLFFDLLIGKKIIKYVAEIKVREKEYPDPLIEQQKIIHLQKEWKKGKQVRYINYLAHTDQLIIFDLNNRFEGLELFFVGEDPTNINYYFPIILPKNTAIKTGEKIKYVKFLQYNTQQTKDLTINNYSQILKQNNINFNYTPINK